MRGGECARVHVERWMLGINWFWENYAACFPPLARGEQQPSVAVCRERIDVFQQSSLATRILRAIIPQDPCNVPVETWSVSLVPSRESAATSGLLPFYFYPAITSL